MLSPPIDLELAIDVGAQVPRLDLWKTAGAIYLYDLDDKAAALRCFRHALALETDGAERAKLESLVRELGG